VLWIKNTLDVAEVECSVAYLPEAQTRPDLKIVVPPRPLKLDTDGFLPAVESYGEPQ